MSADIHPCCLTIAGSDSGGNAGVQADLRAFHAYGLHGCTVLAALTAQNPSAVTAIHPVPANFVAAQLDAVLDVYAIKGLKTGMLADPAAIEAIADRLDRHPEIAKVIDPVMVATSGVRLVPPATTEAIKRRLLPLATLLTPNLPEAEILCGRPVDDPNAARARSAAQARDLARRLHETYGCAVLVKGGHGSGAAAVDVLYDGRTFSEFSLPWIADPVSTHGTGCSLAAALAAELALGREVAAAVKGAKDYVHDAIAGSYRVGPSCGVLGFAKRAALALALTFGALLPQSGRAVTDGDTRPETWFHIIGGNASKEGLTADLTALKAAGVGGIQLFHGHADGSLWPGVTEPIPCLSETWTDLIKFAETECHRLGLTFKMQNCPGWSMSGGPWITPDRAMRTLVAFEPDKRPVFDADDDYHEIGAVTFPAPDESRDGELLRVFRNPQQLNHHWAYEPKTNLWDRPCPAGAWHDVVPMTFAKPGASRLDMWEAKAGWGLREFTLSTNASPVRTVGEKTLVFGHVNAKRRNHPAPPEGTGWECDKMDPRGFEANWNGYLGKLLAAGVKLDGTLVDSWECGVQSWTWKMEEEFARRAGYALRPWLPALFGYVLESEAATEKFLLDWRNVCSRLVEENYYGTMARLAHANGMTIQFETSFGDVLVGDILRYWKYADEPMCEFWSPHDNANGFVYSHDFKPVLPCVSAAHVYGKPRVSAEALTSFNLTFDENFNTWKRDIDRHFARGVTHIVFHTFTHNPVVGGKPPSTSFGGGIGSPFLREQTWWPYLKDFTDYLAFCGRELERGKPVVDILLYLGDAVGHKPHENRLLFDNAYKYDYLNQDALLTRVETKDGRLVLPDGMSYRVLWIPEGTFLKPETEAKLDALAAKGARIVRGAFTPDWPSPVRAIGRDGRRVDWYQRRDGDEDIFFIADGSGASFFVIVDAVSKTMRTIDAVTRRPIGASDGSHVEGRLVLKPHAEEPADAIRRTYGATWTCLLTEARTKLDLGRVRDWATVKVNGKEAARLWCAPYVCDITDFVREGENVIDVEVTSTWYNKLVTDAAKPEAERTTWTLCGPKADAPLHEAGLIGPVTIIREK